MYRVEFYPTREEYEDPDMGPDATWDWPTYEQASEQIKNLLDNVPGCVATIGQ